MQSLSLSKSIFLFAGPALLLCLPAAASAPRTPISIKLELARAPRQSQATNATITVRSTKDAADTRVELMLPAGVTAGTSAWRINLSANAPVVLSTTIVVGAPGNLSISARAVKEIAKGEVWGDMATVPLYVDKANLSESKFEWKVDKVPVGKKIGDGNARIHSLEDTPFAFPKVTANAAGALPATAPAAVSVARVPRPAVAPGMIEITGKWSYEDRSGVWRDIDQQVIEIRRGDGSQLGPAVYCYTWVDGTYSCSFPNPGTTVRVWVRSWVNFNRPGGTDRLGVFSGPEVSGGCGSDSIDCTYPVQTPEISCPDGSSCDAGWWGVVAGEPWLGAHQMTQDLIRSWKRLLFDTKDGAPSAGPGRITYPVPSGHGTHAHVGSGEYDGWISMEAPNQQSADITTHEYGHVVMSNLWTSFGIKWPTSDCPSPHFVDGVSAPGCAYSEGFADFWAWYSNEFYDGTSDASQYGGVFNWPGGASTNMETRGSGFYPSGDQVEGNIAAALGDLLDAANDGPGSNVDLADRVSDGVNHIWHIVSTQAGSNFLAWWNQYRGAHGPSCLELDALRYDSIDYTTSGCNAPPAPTLLSPANGATGVSLNPSLSWNAASGATSYDVYFGTSSTPPFVGNRTVLSYTPGALAGGTQYFWRVVARNSSGGVSSGTANFTTEVETVSAAGAPSGPSSGSVAVSYTYAASGASSSFGHPVQYQFSWGDGTTSAWLPAGVVSASKTWTAAGTYSVRVTARCATHTSIVSPASAPATVSIGGAQVTLTPTSLTFGVTLAGTTSAAQRITLRNSGTSPLTVSSIAATGEFVQSHTCGASVAAGATCTIDVQFRPTARGSRTGRVSITDNAPGSPHVVALTGTGTILRMTPASLAYGVQLVGTKSATRVITLANVGLGPVAISGISLGGTNAAEFGRTHTCGASLAAGASCAVNIAFTPAARGNRTATLTVTHDGGGGSTSAALSGTGSVLRVTPAALTFAARAVGTVSPGQAATLTNVGAGPVALSSVAIGGTNPANFLMTNGCPPSLAPGASCSVSIRFRPNATGPRNAALNIAHDGGGSPSVVALSGTGL